MDTDSKQWCSSWQYLIHQSCGKVHVSKSSMKIYPLSREPLMIRYLPRKWRIYKFIFVFVFSWKLAYIQKFHLSEVELETASLLRNYLYSSAAQKQKTAQFPRKNLVPTAANPLSKILFWRRRNCVWITFIFFERRWLQTLWKTFSTRLRIILHMYSCFGLIHT